MEMRSVSKLWGLTGACVHRKNTHKHTHTHYTYVNLIVIKLLDISDEDFFSFWMTGTKKTKKSHGLR